jgi:hypothetical protein
MLFELSLSNLPRLGALPCAPCTSRPCWGKASFGARLAARFLPILRRVRRSWGLRPGAGGRSPRVLTASYYKKKQKFIRVRPLCRILHTKNYSVRHCCASLEQCLRSAGKRANFWRRKNLPFCTIKLRKFKKFSKKTTIL